MRIIITLIACLLFTSLVAYGADTKQSEKRYQSLVEKIKTNGTAKDFSELRQIFVNTKRYNPYNSKEETLRAPMAKAMGAKKWKKCISLAEKALDYNYLYIRGHLNAAYCYSKLENKNKEKFHANILKSLIKAIADTGDGKSPESAFKTISVNEVQSFLLLSGYIVKQQALIQDELGRFDLMTVTDRQTNEELGLYFDVNVQMGQFLKNLPK
ncbi:MAG: DUF4919 domain-containing protein [Kordiimonadaceae bacterium]|nr:DUF4919 domain-containing protein [Kordiimonadaceae bacterium]